MITLEEKERLKVLYNYNILDTPPDGTYDEIVKLLSKMLDVPIALVTLVDTDRIWFKSAFGLNLNQIKKEEGIGLCSSAILSNEFYLIENAIKDERTRENILVNSDFGLQFYAAAPLTTHDGFNLGTLCVIDKKPRTLTKEEQELMKNLASVIIDNIELRLNARLVINTEIKNEFMFLHELKSSICYVPILTDMLMSNIDNPDEIKSISKMINESFTKGMNIVDEFISKINKKSYEGDINFSNFEITALVENVIENNVNIADRKNQNISFLFDRKHVVNANRKKISELVDNLLSNAIKYSNQFTKIEINLAIENNQIILSVKDEGLGMDENDIANAFKRFNKLSAKPTGNETSTGLGLWIVKEIVDQHKGKIVIESEGINLGTAINVYLPILI